tara:strand:+ start:720 stop:1343 length:624 start_codon:yes stop_codon:yes gene_type:complete
MKLINQLALLLEQESPTFYNWNKKVAGQPVFDYIRRYEGDVKGNHIPYVYDDKIKWVYDKHKKMRMPPKYTLGTTYGTLTIGWGTIDPAVIKSYMDKTMSVSEAENLSKPDINEAARCIKSWQTRRRKDKDDHNDRKLTTSMYIAMIDIAYNLGCPTFVNTKGISKIETGKFKSAQSWIENGLDWGHPKRRKETADLFCRDGGCIDN